MQLVPILRAGLVLLEQLSTVLPATETYHVGYVRDDATLQASCYLNKLPSSFTAEDRILVSDPMLATGRSCVLLIFSFSSLGNISTYNVIFLSIESVLRNMH